MADAREESCFGDGDVLGARGHAVEELERDFALQARLPGTEDATEAALSDRRDDPQRAPGDDFADRSGRVVLCACRRRWRGRIRRERLDMVGAQRLRERRQDFQFAYESQFVGVRGLRTSGRLIDILAVGCGCC